MKRKILTIITIGSIVCMTLTGCGNSSSIPAKSDSTTTVAERTDSSEVESAKEAEKEIEQEVEEVKTEETEGIGIENIFGKAGLYQEDGSFIPWDDLGIDVETDYARDSYKTETNLPFVVFNDNDYSGKLVLPDKVTKIGDCAFLWCENITNIDLPDTLTTIGEDAFEGTSITSIDLSNTQVTEISYGAFSGCTSLTNVVLPDSLTSIGDYAFSNCAFTSIDLSKIQLTIIDYNAFVNCKSLESVVFPDILTEIEQGAFDDCESLTSIDLSNTQVTAISTSAFRGCTSLTSVQLPDTLTDGLFRSFQECTSLESIDLSNTQITRLDYAFEDCTSLTSVKLPNTITSMCDAFDGTLITNIDYAGTMEEWNAIHISNESKFYSAIKTITCLDGVIEVE